MNANASTIFITKLKNGMSSGAPIPKPRAGTRSKVKGWGERRGEPALIYTILNRKDPTKPYEKGITLSEWATAFECLMAHGEVARHWFEKNLTACAKEGGCNFTTIGGVFESLGYARYEIGRYVKAAERAPDLAKD